MADAFRGVGVPYTGKEPGWKIILGRWIEACRDAYQAHRVGREFAKYSVLGPDSLVFSTSCCFNGGRREDIIIGRGFVCRGLLRRETYGTGKIEIGERVYIGDNTIVSSAEGVRIGHHTLIAHNCHIFDNNSHSTNALIRMRHFESLLAVGHTEETFDVATAPVSIGAHCWLGFNVTVMRGVTIGDGCIVASNAVVVKDIPAWSIAAGNPAKAIRSLDNMAETLAAQLPQAE